jgi:hypothetical protein
MLKFGEMMRFGVGGVFTAEILTNLATGRGFGVNAEKLKS